MKNGPYELIVPPAGYPGKLYRGRYAYEHHVVWWQNTGRLPSPGYVIHHKDEDKRNNVFSNLEEKTSSRHSSEHAAPKTLVSLTCALCRKVFTREARNVNHKAASGQENFYCCRSHQVEDQHNRRHAVG